jgi:hypothetical protein
MLACVTAAVRLFARILAAFEHVGLVHVSGHVDVLVPHDLCEIVGVSVAFKRGWFAYELVLFRLTLVLRGLENDAAIGILIFGVSFALQVVCL